MYTKQNKILLIEDNPDDIELIMRALKKSNIINEIIVAKDGEEALDYLFGEGTFGDENKSDLPEVILLDLKLPKISGLEVLKRLRSEEKTKRLPVVVLTTSSEERDLIDSYKLGANSYIQKPVDFEQFVHVVRELGLYWLVLNITPPNNI